MLPAKIAAILKTIKKLKIAKDLYKKIKTNFDYYILALVVTIVFTFYIFITVFTTILNPRYALGTNEYGNLGKEKIDDYYYLQIFSKDKIPWQFIYAIEEYYELKDIDEYIWHDDLNIFWEKNLNYWTEEQKRYYHYEYELDDHGNKKEILVIDDEEKYYFCEEMISFCEEMIEKIVDFLNKSKYEVLGGWVKAVLDEKEEETGYYEMFLGAFRMPFSEYIKYTEIAPEVIETTEAMKAFGIEDRKVELYKPCTVYDKKEDKNIIGDGVVYLLSITDIIESNDFGVDFYLLLLKLGFEEGDAYLIEMYAKCIMRLHGWEDETIEEQRTTKTCERLYEEYLNLPEGYYEELSDEELDVLLSCSYSFPVGGNYTYKHYPYHHGPPSSPSFYPAKDIYASVGTHVYATTSGIISNVHKTDQYNCATKTGPKGGISFLLNGDDGFKYYYAHLSQIYVNNGQRVSPGYLVGTVGATGNCCGVNPHLHLGLSKGGRIRGSIDPTAALNYWEACE